MSDYFAESGYKFILAVGLLVGETPRLKTVCAERGGVEVVLECLKQRKRSSSVCKWGLWALMVSSLRTFFLSLRTLFLPSYPHSPSPSQSSSSSLIRSFTLSWSLSPLLLSSTFSPSLQFTYSMSSYFLYHPQLF